MAKVSINKTEDIMFQLSQKFSRKRYSMESSKINKRWNMQEWHLLMSM